eukprot:CAMPEP_0206056008 /NCGR_PEP_ID=MMETSP1466-20131121/41257_1 /ASSEMBLY_ACC=CAM_ASM_001126 /TAXON_ID=44452 /ORGANISM="Pavlova gyrans, Strain CCMP608" /LENGTH=161 /DNA_ID=CAMNT_0053431239 /DNA_START=172 /DNA_END=658 /DNA_ORIENTATION=+
MKPPQCHETVSATSGEKKPPPHATPAPGQGGSAKVAAHCSRRGSKCNRRPARSLGMDRPAAASEDRGDAVVPEHLVDRVNVRRARLALVVCDEVIVAVLGDVLGAEGAHAAAGAAAGGDRGRPGLLARYRSVAEEVYVEVQWGGEVHGARRGAGLADSAMV